MLRTNRTRQGFTLVELMIGAAITVMIMTILSYCFQTSMQAMSAMRAQGDAADQLRALTTVMKRDFAANHCLEVEGAIGGVRNRGRRISDYPMGVVTQTGFFYLDCPPSTNEGNDGAFDAFRNSPNPAVVGSPAGCRVWMTCVRPGGDDSKLFSATVMIGGAPTVFTSEAAEVSYFLLPAAGSANAATFGGGGGLALYNLHRRQRLIAVDAAKQNALLPAVLAGGDTEVISTYSYTYGGPPVQTFVRPNTLTSLATGETLTASGGVQVFTGPTRPLTIGGAPLTRLVGGRDGDDIILSNVISFEIKPAWEAAGATPAPRPYGGTTAATNGLDVYNVVTNRFSCDYPYDSLGAFPLANFQFDSMYPTANHPRIRVNSIQIRIRLYDPKAKTARQVTIIQDL